MLAASWADDLLEVPDGSHCGSCGCACTWVGSCHDTFSDSSEVFAAQDHWRLRAGKQLQVEGSLKSGKVVFVGFLRGALGNTSVVLGSP